MDPPGAHARQCVQAGRVPDGEGRAHRHAIGVALMRAAHAMRSRALVVAWCIAAAAPSLAATTQLPAETKGDPKPDTLAAENFLKRQRYEDAIRQAKLALGRDERYVPAMVVLAKAYYYQRKYELATSIIDIAKSIDPN